MWDVNYAIPNIVIELIVVLFDFIRQPIENNKAFKPIYIDFTKNTSTRSSI
jgi:hypothetical protein